MHHVSTETIKPRLVERTDIARAINLLRMRGCDREQLLEEITRLFFVDLDEFNQVIESA